MTGLQRYKKIVDEYKSLYKQYNNKEVINIEYKNGFVYLTTDDFSPTKHRIGQFEKMAETIKNAIKTQS